MGAVPIYVPIYSGATKARRFLLSELMALLGCCTKLYHG